jgi:hypothetical protein
MNGKNSHDAGIYKGIPELSLPDESALYVTGAAAKFAFYFSF